MACPFIDEVVDEGAIIMRRAFPKESELSGTGQTHWLFITATCMSNIGSQEMGLRIFVDC